MSLELSAEFSQIITKVFSEGLKAPSLLSQDRGFLDYISGTYIEIRSRSPQQLKEDISSSLYRPGEVLESLVKRPDDETQQRNLPGYNEILSRRAYSSFLIVCEQRGKDKFHASNKTELKVVEPSYFSYIVFPEVIWKYLVRENINFPKNAKIISVNKSITRYFDRECTSLEVPDYEDALYGIAFTSHADGLWVHGVRLPNIDDR